MDFPILRLAIRQDTSTTSTSETSTTSASTSSTSTTTTSTSSTTSETTSSTTSSTTSETTSSSTTSSTTSTTSDTSTTSTSTSSSTISSTPTPTPTSSEVTTTDASGQTRTIVTVITAVPSSTRSIAPTASSNSDHGDSGFFHNTGAVAGTFTAVGIVALVLIFIVATAFIRRRRAKAWDREIAEAAREARATGTTGLPDEYLDEPGPHPFAPVGGGYGGSGYLGPSGGGGGYPASMSEAGSHGTYGAYGQAPMGHSDGGEMYQMRDFGASGPGPGGLFDHNAAYAAGAAGLGAGAAGIGIARARSQHGPHSANSGPDPNDPNGYYSYPSPASSPPPNLERNLSNGSQHTNSTGYSGQPSSFAAALAEGAGGSGPYPAFLAPGGMQQAMTHGQQSVPQSVLDAAGLGAATTSGSGSPSPGSPPPASTATSTTAAPEKESYAAHYAKPVGSSPKQSMEGGEDAYGGIGGGGLAYDESEGGHGADKGLAPQAQTSRTSSDSAHHLPNPFGRAIESDSEEEESSEGGGRKVLRVANE